MTSPLPTVIELLGKAVSFLEAEGVSSPRLDAEVMLANILGLDRIHLYVNYDRPLEEHEVNQFRQAIVRRAQKTPVAYITGKKEFMSLEFAVTPAVLIPRPETELLVEQALELLGGMTLPADVVDVGTGSGAIAVCLAKSPRVRRLWAIDLSSQALQVAKRNGERHGVSEKVQWVQGDMLKPLLQSKGEGVDMIVSNPPYVPTGAIGRDCPEVLKEPRAALDGGKDGLDYYRILVAQSPQVLRPSGWLCLEIGDGQGRSVAELMERQGPFTQVRVIPDLAGRERVVLGTVKEIG